MLCHCINVNKNNLIGAQDEPLSYLAKNMFTIGVPLNSIMTIAPNREQVFSCLKNASDCDLVVVLGTDDSKVNFEIKNTIADYLKLSMDRNPSSVRAVENYLANAHKTQIKDMENEFYIPKLALPLDNMMSHLQGFASFRNNIIVFLPNDYESVKYLFNNSLFPIITKELKIAYTSMTIKLFGINEKEIWKTLKDLFDANSDIIVNTLSENLDTSLIIRYSMLLEKGRIDAFVSTIYERLRKFIYSDGDTSLYQMALDLLTISNSSLAVCETITGGNIASEFNRCDSNSKHLVNSVNVYNSEKALTQNLSVNSQVFKSSGFVSVESTYEIASAMLEKGSSNLVLVTCGDIDSENHTCYIAVGDYDGIHVYKNTCIGTKQQIMDTVSKCAVFYLIKKLKQNDLYFNKIYV